MDRVSLMRRANQAGLKIKAVGNRLVVRGPESAEALAQAILARKLEILELLRSRARTRSEIKGPRVKPGDCVQWESPRFGQRSGRVVFALGRESVIVQSQVVPSNLTLVDIDAITEVLSDRTAALVRGGSIDQKGKFGLP